jgi:hypothetical protein
MSLLKSIDWVSHVIAIPRLCTLSIANGQAFISTRLNQVPGAVSTGGAVTAAFGGRNSTMHARQACE